MSGVALTTDSPSSTSSRRSTPCVEGCCGPIEIVICVSSGRSTISNCGGMVAEDIITFLIRVFRVNPWPQIYTENTDQHSFQTVRFVTSQWKILAQRMSLPIIRQENASQIRMAVENHAKHVE